MPHRTYAGVDARHAWNGDGRQAQVYGGRTPCVRIVVA